MNCLSCANATTANPFGGVSPHRLAMWSLGFLGCAKDKSEAVSYPLEHTCESWTEASAKQMEARRNVAN